MIEAKIIDTINKVNPVPFSSKSVNCSQCLAQV
jgi:hypothetical protein